jgi:Tfp pilus assembly protein PilV
LIEVLVTLCFVTVAAMGCLSLAALAVKTYQLSYLRWKQTVETWNQTQELRSAAWKGDETGEVVVSGAVPLRRIMIRTEGKPATQVWEVLHAKK